MRGIYNTIGMRISSQDLGKIIFMVSPPVLGSDLGKQLQTYLKTNTTTQGVLMYLFGGDPEL
jgi:hypothetical protein